MQFNLSLVYSTILTILFFLMSIVNVGAASIDFDSLQHSEIFGTQFSGVSISTKNVGDESDRPIISDGKKRSTEDNDLEEPDEASSSSGSFAAFFMENNPGSTNFDNEEINFSGSAAVDNSRFYPIPEPATMLMVGSGLIVLASIGRKKFQKKKRAKRS